MSSSFGKNIQVSLFGESHGPAIGVVMDGLPAGIPINENTLQAFLNRRAPGRSKLTTSRQEADQPEFLSGYYQGHTTGSPLAAIIRNTDQRSGDYQNLADIPRPGHADYTAYLKYKGFADMRGGGHFSGRLTAPLCIAGGIALQYLKTRDIYLAAHLKQVADITDASFTGESKDELIQLSQKAFPTLDDQAGQTMQAAIEKTRAKGDSLGGIVEVLVNPVPAGLGSPMFDGIESQMAKVLFGIPGVKGVSFGSGFHAASMTGSTHNDPFRMEDGQVKSQSNHAGGMLGGISNGMPILCQVAFKPTPSIGQEQASIRLSDQSNTSLGVKGRHDPCIAIRAVPVVEAATALVLLDLLLEEEN